MKSIARIPYRELVLSQEEIVFCVALLDGYSGHVLYGGVGTIPLCVLKTVHLRGWLSCGFAGRRNRGW